MGKQIQGADGRANLGSGDTEIAGGGGQTAMAQQQLDGAHIGPCLEQMDGEGMAQAVGQDGLRKAAETAGFFTSVVDRFPADGRPGRLPSKSQCWGLSTRHQVRKISKSLGESIT